jgi:hypothetical protein
MAALVATAHIGEAEQKRLQVMTDMGNKDVLVVWHSRSDEKLAHPQAGYVHRYDLGMLPEWEW